MTSNDEHFLQMAEKAGFTISPANSDIGPISTTLSDQLVEEPVVTDPVITEPVVTDTNEPTEVAPVIEPTPTPSFDVLGELNKQLGTNFQTLNEIPDTLTEYQRLRGLEQEFTLQKTQYESPFANENVAAYNEFVRKTGIEDPFVFNRLNGYDPSKISDVETIALKKVLASPELATEYELMKDLVASSYDIEAPLEGEEESKESKMARLRLRSDALEARRDVLAVKEKMKYEAPKIDMEAETRRVESFKPVTGEIMAKLATRQYPLGIGDEMFTFVLSKEQAEQQQLAAIEYAKRSGLQADKAGIEQVAAFIDYNIMAQHANDILKLQRETLISEMNRKKVETYNNPTLDKPQQPSDETVLDPYRENYNKIHGEKKRDY